MTLPGPVQGPQGMPPALDTEQRRADWARLQSAALEASANAILIIDVKGFVQWANPAYYQLSGLSAHEALGHNLQELVTENLQEQGFFERLWHTIEDGQVWKGELLKHHKSGARYHEEMTITPVRDAQGAITHFIVVKQDITALKRIAEAADAGSRAKSDFLANMSHEIRTPMNGVIGMVDILQHTKLEPAQVRMLDTIQKSSLALLTILNDILDFSKIEAGKLRVEYLPTHLRELCEGVAQLMVASSVTHTMELSVYVSPRLPHWIISDPTRLRQVLINLLGNAVKFSSGKNSQAARVMLRVEPCTRAQGGAGVRICVADSGIGMSPETMAQLFRPFSQADESTSRNFGGTGLGLSISQRLVELMGGCITVQSTLGAGSAFSFELALHEAPPSTMLTFGPSLVDVQVLVVVGDGEMRTIVTEYCQDCDAGVTVLAHVTALQHYFASGPQLPAATIVVLGMDVSVPTDQLGLPAGVGVVRLVRHNGRNTLDETQVRASPLHYHELIRGIAVASGRLAAPAPAAQRQRARTERALHEAAQEPQDPHLILLAEDNETNRDVVQAQLSRLGYASEAAADGLMALALWRTQRFALLLTDCHMPNMDGFELTAAIRLAEPAGSHFPIVAITANAMHGEAQRCRERGMDDYLSKPMRMEDLAPVLHKWLPLPSSQAAPAQDLAASAQPAPKGLMAVWDSSALGQLVGDNPEMQRQLLGKFLVNAEEQVARMASALAQPDLGGLANVAHTLKSSARMVGAMLLGEICEGMEDAALDASQPGCCALLPHLTSAFLHAREAIRQHLLYEEQI